MPERRLEPTVQKCLVVLAVGQALWVWRGSTGDAGAPSSPQALDLHGHDPFALLALCALAAWAAMLGARRAWRILPDAPSPRAPWRGATAIVAWMLPLVAGGILMSSALAEDLRPFWIQVAGGRPDDAPHVARIAGDTMARLLCVAVVVWPIWRTGYLAALGWRAPGAMRQVLGALVQLALFVPPFALVYGVSLGIQHALGVPPVVQPVVARVLGAGIDTPLFWALAVSSAIVAPLWEEVLYRGLLYSGLRRTRDMPTAVVLSAAVFAVAHLNAFVVLPLFAFGVLLALVRERTGSLVAPVAMHALFNALQLVYMKS